MAAPASQERPRARPGDLHRPPKTDPRELTKDPRALTKAPPLSEYENDEDDDNGNASGVPSAKDACDPATE